MKGLITINDPKSPISEAYRGIRTSIQFSNLDKKIKVINVTSSKQGEGKTTVLANLATTFANLEKKVLILDGDLRNPTIHRMFELSNVCGLTDVLLEEKSFEECVHCTDTKNLHVLTCGAIPPNPSEMLASNKMTEFVNSLKDDLQRRDFIINTLCIDKDGNFVDLMKAINDIDNKIINCVGEANIKLSEDPLRILRCIRFACKLNFTINEDVTNSIKKYTYKLKSLSNKRVKKEINAILKLENGMDYIKKFNLEEYIH